MTELVVAAEKDEELHVLFKVAGAELALPFGVVLQMESYTGATSVPGAPAFVAGIVPIRGRAVPVVDLRVRFGLPAIEPTLDSRVVVGQLGDRVVALLVDSAREVLRIGSDALRAPPPIVADGQNAFVRSIAHVGKRMIMILDFAKVIGQEPIHAG